MQRRKAPSTPKASAASTVERLRTTLSASLVEREAEVDAILLALVAREHVLMVGPPGTAKSALATGLTQAIDGARSFQALLTKFTTPEELFGPLKLSALKQDRYERAIAGYAPAAEVLFLDEIWKASSAILNTTLTLLQERMFDNGGSRIRCPLRLAVAASNEWPSTDDAQELGAVFDRFLIRCTVRPVSTASRHRLLYSELPAVRPVATLAEIDGAALEASRLPVSERAVAAMDEVLGALAAEGIRPGDRRMRRAVGIARAAAYIDRAEAVQPKHLECLGDVLWGSPEQSSKCAEIVSKITNPVGAALVGILREVDEILETVKDATTRTAAIRKLEQSEAAIKALPEGNGRAAKALKHVRDNRTQLTAAALGMTAEEAAAFIARQA